MDKQAAQSWPPIKTMKTNLAGKQNTLKAALFCHSQHLLQLQPRGFNTIGQLRFLGNEMHSIVGA